MTLGPACISCPIFYYLLSDYLHLLSLLQMQSPQKGCLTNTPLLILYSDNNLFQKYHSHFFPGSFLFTFQDSDQGSLPPGRLPSSSLLPLNVLALSNCDTHLTFNTHSLLCIFFLLTRLVFSSRSKAERMSSLSRPLMPNIIILLGGRVTG